MRSTICRIWLKDFFWFLKPQKGGTQKYPQVLNFLTMYKSTRSPQRDLPSRRTGRYKFHKPAHIPLFKKNIFPKWRNQGVKGYEQRVSNLRSDPVRGINYGTCSGVDHLQWGCPNKMGLRAKLNHWLCHLRMSRPRQAKGNTSTSLSNGLRAAIFEPPLA